MYWSLSECLGAISTSRPSSSWPPSFTLHTTPCGGSSPRISADDAQHHYYTGSTSHCPVRSHWCGGLGEREKKKVCTIGLHTFISTRLSPLAPFTPLLLFTMYPLLSRLLFVFWVARIRWLPFVSWVVPTPLAPFVVRSPRSNRPLLTPHRYHYPSFVETITWHLFIRRLRVLVHDPVVDSVHTCYLPNLDHLVICLTNDFVLTLHTDSLAVLSIICSIVLLDVISSNSFYSLLSGWINIECDQYSLLFSYLIPRVLPTFLVFWLLALCISLSKYHCTGPRNVNSVFFVWHRNCFTVFLL